MCYALSRCFCSYGCVLKVDVLMEGEPQLQSQDFYRP